VASRFANPTPNPGPNIGPNNGARLAVALRAFEGGDAQRDMTLLCNAIAAQGVRLTVLALRVEGPLRALLDPAIPVAAITGRQLRYAIPGLRQLICATPPSLVIRSEAGLNLCTLIAVRSLARRQRPKLLLREVGSVSIAQYRDPYARNRTAYRILRRAHGAISSETSARPTRRFR
jgi:hypothetical protein